MPGLYAIRPFAPGPNADRGTLPKVSPANRSERQREDRPSQHSSKSRRLPPVHISSAVQTQTCAQTIRPKQVTDPLTEPVKARIYGAGLNAGTIAANYGSSGSDHEPSSVSLVAMVHEFMEDEREVGSCGRARCNCLNGTCNGDSGLTDDSEGEKSIAGGQFCEILEGVTSCTSTKELFLVGEVAKAVETMNVSADSGCKVEGVECMNGCLRRSVMRHLRHAGYNAAICKSRWEHTGGFPAGDYEYIDVIIHGRNGKPERIIVDMQFKAQFEIARASNQYRSLLQVLPNIFVGRSERLQQILKIMSDAAKRSLKKRGMHLPPWRKQWYMQAKWFSSYKRTTNEEPPAHINSEEVLKREFSSIALRGSQFHSKYTEGMETLYEITTEAKVSRGKERGKIVAQEKILPQEFERRVNNFGSDSRTITVMSSDWELPAVNPRNGQKREMVFGLANALKEAGISFRLTTKRDQQDERQLMGKQ